MRLFIDLYIHGLLIYIGYAAKVVSPGHMISHELAVNIVQKTRSTHTVALHWVTNPVQTVQIPIWSQLDISFLFSFCLRSKRKRELAKCANFV